MVALAETEASSLRIHEVSKSFPAPDDPFTRRQALSNISLSIAAGELVSLIAVSQLFFVSLPAWIPPIQGKF